MIQGAAADVLLASCLECMSSEGRLQTYDSGIVQIGLG